MNELWSAVLFTDSPHYREWYAILGTHAVPLESPQLYRANLGEERDVKIYKLDLAKLSAGQRERLMATILNRFPSSTHDDVEKQLDEQGFPIREADVVVAFSMRAFS